MGGGQSGDGPVEAERMTPAVKAVIDRVLLHEGGIAQVPGETWITRFGQTPDWLATWGLTPQE